MTAIQRAFFGALVSGVGSLFLLGIGLLRVLFALFSDTHVSTDGMWPGTLLYPVGFMVAGAVVGFAWPLQRLRLGRYLLGILGAGIVFVFIMQVVSGPVTQWDGVSYFTLAVCTLIFGLATGYQFRE